MLAGTVNAGIGLLMKQADQVVTEGDLLHGLHDKLVVVGGDVRGGKNGGHLVLRRCHLVVLGLGRDAHLPEFGIEVIHVIGDPVFNGAEILVLELLALGRGRAEDRSSCQHQVDPLQIEFLVDQEVFLFRAYGRGYFRGSGIAQRP